MVEVAADAEGVMIQIESDECYINEDMPPKVNRRYEQGWELINMAPHPNYQNLHILYWKKVIPK